MEQFSASNNPTEELLRLLHGNEIVLLAVDEQTRPFEIPDSFHVVEPLPHEPAQQTGVLVTRDFLDGREGRYKHDHTHRLLTREEAADPCANGATHQVDFPGVEPQYFSDERVDVEAVSAHLVFRGFSGVDAIPRVLHNEEVKLGQETVRSGTSSSPRTDRRRWKCLQRSRGKLSSARGSRSQDRGAAPGCGGRSSGRPLR